MIHTIHTVKRKVHGLIFPNPVQGFSTNINSSQENHINYNDLTNQMADDKIISKIIPTIDKEGNRTHLVHKIKSKEEEDWKSLALYGSLGFYIIIPILLGLFIGIAVDDLTGKKPLFTLVCLGFGTVSGIYNLVRTLKK